MRRSARRFLSSWPWAFRWLFRTRAIDSYYFNDSVATFFEANNDASLAESMLRLIEDPELRERQVRDAQAFVQD